MNISPDAVDDAARQLEAENDAGDKLARSTDNPARSTDQPTNDPVLTRVLAMLELREMQVNPRYGQVRGGRPSYDLANAAFTRGTEAEVPCTYCHEGLCSAREKEAIACQMHYIGRVFAWFLYQLLL